MARLDSLDRIKENIRKLIFQTEVQIRVGILGQENSELAIIAGVNEFGNDRIPERSFLRSTLTENNDKYQAAFSKVLRQFFKSEKNFELGINRIALQIEADVKQKIVDLDDPPNSPITIAQKGSSNPLIDTGRMRQSITHVVKYEYPS